MKVKFNGEESDLVHLVGGGPHGTLLGQLEYLVLSNDNADMVSPNDRYKYIDDLTILQLICLSGLLREYNFNEHVASDIGVGELYLPSETFETQQHLDKIASWSEDNLVKLNEGKCDYMVFSRAKVPFNTRLTLNNHTLDKVSATKILGIWITDDLSWEKNTKAICQKSYARMSMLTKLRYVGVRIEDLVEICVLYIRSLTEYCSTVFHSSLTVEQSQDLERIQKTCLKVILGDNYVSYAAALEMTGLETLHERREQRCRKFALKCIKHPTNHRLFPKNTNQEMNGMEVRNRERFEVNFARTESYRKSAIPYCQRILNKHFQS